MYLFTKQSRSFIQLCPGPFMGKIWNNRKRFSSWNTSYDKHSRHKQNHSRQNCSVMKLVTFPWGGWDTRLKAVFNAWSKSVNICYTSHDWSNFRLHRLVDTEISRIKPILSLFSPDWYVWFLLKDYNGKFFGSWIHKTAFYKFVCTVWGPAQHLLAASSPLVTKHS